MQLSLRGLLQSMEGAGVENQFSQEVGHVDDAATSRESARQPWLQIESAHRHNSRHRNSVRHDRRYPDRAMGRDNPGTVTGADGHHSARGVNQLVAIVKVEGNSGSSGIVARQGCDWRPSVTRWIKDRSLPFLRLAFLRHSLSQYRKYARLAMS